MKVWVNFLGKNIKSNSFFNSVSDSHQCIINHFANYVTCKICQPIDKSVLDLVPLICGTKLVQVTKSTITLSKSISLTFEDATKFTNMATISHSINCQFKIWYCTHHQPQQKVKTSSHNVNNNNKNFH